MGIINTNVRENKEWREEQLRAWILDLKDVWTIVPPTVPNISGYKRLSGTTLLRGADLRGVLSPTYLYKVELDGADLRKTDFSGSIFQMVDFSKANLEGAVLRDVMGCAFDTVGLAVGVYFEGANLIGADLRGAYLRGADFTGADITGACLEGAIWDKNTRWPEGFTPPN